MIGHRLKRSREAMGFSLRDLEAAIGGEVSAQAIGKYERGEMMPGSAALLAMAKALRVRPEYLLSTREIELSGVDFRKAPQANLKSEKAVEAAVLDRVERYLEVEELMPDTSDGWHAPNASELTIGKIDDAEQAAERLRELWKLGIDAIPDMADLLEEKGIKVISLDLPEEVSGSKAFVQRKDADSVPIIVVNAVHNGLRQRFTLAHELAHLVLNCDKLDHKEEEKAADRFAGAFLMAREMMTRVLGGHRTVISLGELAELQKMFKVSIACLVVRCSQLGLLSKTAYGKLWGQIRALSLNSFGAREPHNIEPERPKRMERLCLRAVAEGAISDGKAAELMRLSVRDVRAMAQGA